MLPLADASGFRQGGHALGRLTLATSHQDLTIYHGAPEPCIDFSHLAVQNGKVHFTVIAMWTRRGLPCVQGDKCWDALNPCRLHFMFRTKQFVPGVMLKEVSWEQAHPNSVSLLLFILSTPPRHVLEHSL